MLKTISPSRAYELSQSGEARLVDIRETSEYADESVPGARLVPLSIAGRYPVRDEDAPQKPVIFFCHSGRRTEKAADMLSAAAGGADAYQMEGGITGWKQAGLPIVKGRASMPLFRQIQIGAGSLVLAGVVGSWFWPPMFWLSAFVGMGLVFAGLTGFCGLGILLQQMPWNKK